LKSANCASGFRSSQSVSSTRRVFSQRITEDGWQEAHSLRLRFEDLPMPLMIDQDEQGNHLGRTARSGGARRLENQVGRSPSFCWIATWKTTLPLIAADRPAV
jgi:hypothetical protein